MLFVLEDRYMTYVRMYLEKTIKNDVCIKR